MQNAGPQQPDRRWKRTAAIAVLLLAGGAVVNVTVAWWCVWRMWPPWGDVIDANGNLVLDTFQGTAVSDEDSLHADRFGWSPRPPSGEYEFVVQQYVQKSVGYRETSYAEQAQRMADSMMFTTGAPPRSAPIMKRVTGGLPFHSVVGEAWSDYRQPPIEAWTFYGGTEERHALELQGALSFDRSAQLWGTTFTVGQLYPFRPMFPGFIINTLFYALLLWLHLFAAFSVRRMIRRRRGLCEQCAYPIGTSPVCTECGAAVRCS